jgi:hypothetical protein
MRSSSFGSNGMMLNQPDSGAEPGGVRRPALGNRRCGPAFRGLEPRTRADFLRQVRPRLEKLSPADFIDPSEVIAAVAVAQ